ncbi:hypothetical protein LTR16_000739, partial [Cryomyces antarcticus]
MTVPTNTTGEDFVSLPILDLSGANSPTERGVLLRQQAGIDRVSVSRMQLQTTQRLMQHSYHDAVQPLSYRFVHLIEEAFGIPIGTFDGFFLPSAHSADTAAVRMPPQHRIKLIKYPPSSSELVGDEQGLEVLNRNGEWIAAPPVAGTLVVNFGNAFEAATEGAVKATVHRVLAPTSTSSPRYSIPFFQGLPLDLTVSEIQSYIPQAVRLLRKQDEYTTKSNADDVSAFLDPRWDSL